MQFIAIHDRLIFKQRNFVSELDFYANVAKTIDRVLR